MAPIIDAYSELNGDGYRFQDLVYAYFKKLEGEPTPDPLNPYFGITNVRKLGRGIDRGRDLLITYTVKVPLLYTLEKRLVVQVKFHNRNINCKDLGNVSLSNLLHANYADGYLIICRKDISTNLGELLLDLSKSKQDKHNYFYWTGHEFFERLIRHTDIMLNFFPAYSKTKAIKK